MRNDVRVNELWLWVSCAIASYSLIHKHIDLAPQNDSYNLLLNLILPVYSQAKIVWLIGG